MLKNNEKLIVSRARELLTSESQDDAIINIDGYKVFFYRSYTNKSIWNFKLLIKAI